MMGNPVTALTVQLGEQEITLNGRAAWMLDALINAGMIGLTTIDNPAPRISHYIFLLRRNHFVIESQPENHGGAFAGHHARYILKSPVTVIERQHGTGRARQRSTLSRPLLQSRGAAA
jgi:hypothetical protein